MSGQIFPETYPLSPEDPDFRCSSPDCGLDAEDGEFQGEFYCQEHLAETLVDEELDARIDAGGSSSDLTIRLADYDEAGAVRDVLAWAKATGRGVEVSVIVRVDEVPSKRGCEGIGPRHTGYPTTVRIAGRDRFLCDPCVAEAQRYDERVRGVAS